MTKKAGLFISYHFSVSCFGRLLVISIIESFHFSLALFLSSTTFFSRSYQALCQSPSECLIMIHKVTNPHSHLSFFSEKSNSLFPHFFSFLHPPDCHLLSLSSFLFPNTKTNKVQEAPLIKICQVELESIAQKWVRSVSKDNVFAFFYSRSIIYPIN